MIRDIFVVVVSIDCVDVRSTPLVFVGLVVYTWTVSKIRQRLDPVGQAEHRLFGGCGLWVFPFVQHR
jgi:hypothetical protein